MPRPTCQLNLTLDVPTAEYVEELAFASHKRPSGIGRDLLLERLELAKAGWKDRDDETKELLKKNPVSLGPEKEEVRGCGEIGCLPGERGANRTLRSGASRRDNSALSR